MAAKCRLPAYCVAVLTGWMLLAACAGPAPSAAPAASRTPAQPTPTVGAVPTTALSASEFTWSAEIIQNSQTLTATNDLVALARADFTLRVKMPQPLPVKLNALNTDTNFKALQPGFTLTDDCTLALCTGM